MLNTLHTAPRVWGSEALRINACPLLNTCSEHAKYSSWQFRRGFVPCKS